MDWTNQIQAGPKTKTHSPPKLWWGVLLLTLFCLLIPIRYTFLKVGLLAGGAALWGSSLYLFGGKLWVKAICILVAAFAILTLVFLRLPGRAYDVNALRTEYVESLLSYKGTFYIFGGGNRIGIDCSGLVQRGLIDAFVQQALATRNPALARDALSLWWHNRSARALGSGYRGDTHLLFEGKSLNALDYAKLEPGDLAVMSDGIHVLAYVGNDTWIEADPAPMRVILATPPRNDFYFNTPVRIMRWRYLDPGDVNATELTLRTPTYGLAAIALSDISIIT
jgi:cell wall-associated NlpC family hydrolase